MKSKCTLLDPVYWFRSISENSQIIFTYEIENVEEGEQISQKAWAFRATVGIHFSGTSEGFALRSFKDGKLLSISPVEHFRWRFSRATFALSYQLGKTVNSCSEKIWRSQFESDEFGSINFCQRIFWNEFFIISLHEFNLKKNVKKRRKAFSLFQQTLQSIQ